MFDDEVLISVNFSFTFPVELMILVSISMVFLWQLQLMKMAKDTDSAESTHVKQDMYLVVVEGFQLLSEWTGRIWEQSAWKFSRPAKDATPFDPERSNEVTDYEKVGNNVCFSFQLCLKRISFLM